VHVAAIAAKRGLKPLARILGHASHARLPSEFTIAPVYGTMAFGGRIGTGHAKTSTCGKSTKPVAVVTIGGV